jgi:hypothetical protein
MLLILIGSLLAAWALVIVVVVAACVSAARGDRDMLAAAHALAPARGRLRRIA